MEQIITNGACVKYQKSLLTSGQVCSIESYYHLASGEFRLTAFDDAGEILGGVAEPILNKAWKTLYDMFFDDSDDCLARI